MKKIGSLAVMLVFTLWVCAACSKAPKPTPEEQDVLGALKKVQEGVDAKIGYGDFSRLLDDAGSKIETLKRAEKKSDCFLNAATKCFASYEIGGKAWKLKDDAQDEKRRMDMDTTLSFSMGFASVSLAKAGECFKKK
jgi:hypothetical protein